MYFMWARQRHQPPSSNHHHDKQMGCTDHSHMGGLWSMTLFYPHSRFIKDHMCYKGTSRIQLLAPFSLQECALFSLQEFWDRTWPLQLCSLIQIPAFKTLTALRGLGLFQLVPWSNLERRATKFSKPQEIRQSLRKTAPKHHSLPKQTLFKTAYVGGMRTCSGCHAMMWHPFKILKSERFGQCLAVCCAWAEQNLVNYNVSAIFAWKNYFLQQAENCLNANVFARHCSKKQWICW